MNFILLTNVKMSIIAGILTFINMINYWLWLFKPENAIDFGYISIYKQFKFQLSMKNLFHNLGAMSESLLGAWVISLVLSPVALFWEYLHCRYSYSSVRKQVRSELYVYAIDTHTAPYT